MCRKSRLQGLENYLPIPTIQKLKQIFKYLRMLIFLDLDGKCDFYTIHRKLDSSKAIATLRLDSDKGTTTSAYLKTTPVTTPTKPHQ